MTWGGMKDGSCGWCRCQAQQAGAGSSQVLPTISSLELWKCRNALGQAFPPTSPGRSLPTETSLPVGRGATVTCSTQSSWIKAVCFPTYSLSIAKKTLQSEWGKERRQLNDLRNTERGHQQGITLLNLKWQRIGLTVSQDELAELILAKQ